jgi:tRNA (Thr-GGU) A37 N-methylase
VPHPDYGLKLKILGVVRCDALQADDVPAEGLPSRVILDEAYRSALNGVEVGDFLYVLVIFHLPGARGPTDSTGKECVDGAFSIRTSVRPNLIGMTLSKVTAIDGMEIYFEWLDFVDGTPVIDLKRYSWRWECALSTRRLDRRVAEKQFSRDGWVRIETALKASANATAGLRWSFVGDVEQYLDLATQGIADDRVIAWFAGRMEFGRRALGNRSILALPGGRDIKDRLNQAVKLREPATDPRPARRRVAGPRPPTQRHARAVARRQENARPGIEADPQLLRDFRRLCLHRPRDAVLSGDRVRRRI